MILSSDIIDLVERFAKNTHGIWATGRVSEGWQYGAVRDDEKKHHPCLVPYRELPENEKDYDRNTAVEALKLISKMGYDIVKRE